MGTTSQKLTYLNDTKTQLKDMINYGLDTGEKITSETTFRNYVKSLFDAFIKTMTYPDVLYNNLPKVTGEGTSVTLNDTVYAPMRVELSPSALEQKTTTGKNLFNKEATVSYIAHASYTYNNGVYTITPDGTGNINLNISCVISPGSYVFNSNTFLSNATILRDASNTSVYNFRSSYSNISFTTTIASTVLQFNWSNPNNTTPFTLDLNSLMISTTGGEYEEYTGGQPSPNPQYPQQIHTVSGENEVGIEGNLFSSEWEQGEIRSTGVEASTNSVIRTKGYIPVIPNQHYAFSRNIATGYIQVRCYDKDKTYLGSGTNYITLISGSSASNPMNTNDAQCVIAPKENVYYLRFNDFSNNLATKYMMVKGDTPLDYQPYTKQTYPLSLGDLEYCKIGDYEDEFVKGKNLFDKDSATYVNNKILDDNGEQISSTASGYLSSYVVVKPNTTYTISGNIATGSASFRLYYYGRNKDWISRTESLSNLLIPYTFTTPNNCYFMQFQYNIVYYDASTIMINEGPTALSYEPYITKWYLKKNIGKVVLDGSESGWFNDGGGAPFSVHVPLKGVNNKLMVMSDYFRGVTYSSSWTVYDTLVSTSAAATTNPAIKFRYTGIGGLENFKTWLGTHNTTVYYVLATPTNTPLSDTLQTQLDNIQKAISYQDQTNVSQTNNDLPFVIKLSAIEDLSGIFELIQG